MLTQNVLYLHQIRWLEFLKKYDMSILYHLGKANVVADALSQMSIGSVAHVSNRKNELVNDAYRLTWLGVRVDFPKGGFMVHDKS